MKYKTIIETDDFEDFEFFEDGNGKYIHGIDAGAENNEWIALYFTECEKEPKTGHWIDGGEYICFGGRQKAPCICSVCRKSALNEPWYYCPNCGARMEGEQNE